MHSKVYINLATRNDISYVTNLYYNPPMRVLSIPPSNEIDKKAVYLMLTSSSPGMLSGDHYEMYVQQAPDTQLTLISQAYQHLFDMEEEARQHNHFELQKGAKLCYIPYPIVPHKSAKYKGTTEIRLNDNCICIFAEIITCGRKHHGEIFTFNYFKNDTEIYFNKQLILKDKLYLQPNIMPIEGMGFMEGYTHQGTLFLLDTHEKPLMNPTSYIVDLLAPYDELIYGYTALPQKGYVLRMLTQGGELIYNLFQQIGQHIWTQHSKKD